VIVTDDPAGDRVASILPLPSLPDHNSLLHHSPPVFEGKNVAIHPSTVVPPLSGGQAETMLVRVAGVPKIH
jgi:hypothetical protein